MTGESNIKEVFSEIARRERRVYRRSWLYSAIALVIAAAWLSFTVYKTKALGDRAAAQKTQIENNDKQLAEQRRAIDENKKTLKRLAPYALDDFGWKNAKDAQANNYQLDQSLDADSARQQIVSATNNGQRASISIEYFWKDVDSGKVEQALRELGFKVDLKTAVNPLPTNSIWFGRQVKPEDAKLVAFTLMRAGVQIKEIRYFKPGSPRANSSLIQVGSDPNLLDRPALTVEQIRSKTQFESVS